MPRDVLPSLRCCSNSAGEPVIVAREIRLLRNKTTALSDLRLPPSASMRTSPEMVHLPFSKSRPPTTLASVGPDPQVALRDDDVAEHGGVVAVSTSTGTRIDDDFLVLARYLRGGVHA